MSDTRDRRAVAQSFCPTCRAYPGEPCRFMYRPRGNNRPRVHIERRRANQERIRQEPAQ